MPCFFAALMSLVILSIKWNGFKIATTEMSLLKVIGQDCKCAICLLANLLVLLARPNMGLISDRVCCLGVNPTFDHAALYADA